VQIDPKRAIPRDEQDKTSKIFVGGIGQDVVEEEFKEYFEQFGTVLDATLMIDKETGRPRGFGFVTFDDDSAVENCMAHSPLYLKQKMVIPLYVGMVNASD
jgi:RNA-binding protein Musashi